MAMFVIGDESVNDLMMPVSLRTCDVDASRVSQRILSDRAVVNDVLLCDRGQALQLLNLALKHTQKRSECGAASF